MPQPSFRSFLGVAKDTTNTYVNATNTTGTSGTLIQVGGTAGISASSSLIIWDGPRTETLSVSSVSGTVVTTAGTATYAHAPYTYVSVQPTASVGPTDYIPITAFDFQDMYAQLDDKGLRGSAVEDFGVIQGAADGAVSIGGDVICDTFGYIIAMLGSTDFTAGGGTPNTHAFAIKNTGDSQATPYILYDYDVTNTRGFSALKFEEVGVKIDPKGLITWTAKAKSNQSGVVTTPTASYSSIKPSAAWTTVTTIGGVTVPVLLNAEFTFKRPVEVIHTALGIQAPYKVWQGPLSFAGKLNIIMEDDTQLLNYINSSQPSFDVTANTGTGATQTTLQIHSTNANYEGAKIVQTGKPWVELEIPFRSVANSTDATTSGGGLSPVKVTLKNAKATGTYL